MDLDTILERRRLRRRATFWRVTAFVVAALALVAVAGRFTDIAGLRALDPGVQRGHVAVIRVDGFIATRPGAVEFIEAAAESDSARAIMVRIDSGGGAASGGEALYRAMRNAAVEKPVVAVIDGVGASAAYMTAIAADHVVARESAITGSIGVIFQYAHFEELLTRLGAEYEEVKSTPLKGEPSLFRAPAPGADEMVRAVVDDTYDWFVGLVEERRGMTEVAARRVSDGRIFTGRQALQLDLIDALGGEAEARAWLAAEHDIPESLPTREWKRDESLIGLLRTDALTALAGLLGLDETAAALVPQRLMVDGLLSVWQAPLSAGSER
jgi:protease-4